METQKSNSQFMLESLLLFEHNCTRLALFGSVWKRRRQTSYFT